MALMLRRSLLAVVAGLLVVAPSLAFGAGVQALFDLSSPSGGPFPSDRFAVEDDSHLTGVRVNLPKPDCATRPSDCADIDVINTLDGFNLQPRLAIPFTGPIDVSTVTSRTVFLVSLGDARGGRGGKIVGTNQVVWDPTANTLYAESDELLDQHTRYVLVVTSGVRDAAGDPVEASASFRSLRDGFDDDARDRPLTRYSKELLGALEEVELRRGRVVAASVFTTQSVTAVLEKIRDQIKRRTPRPATILGTFPLSEILGIQFTRQIGTAPTFSTSFLPTPALSIFPGAVGAVAFGTYASPDYETADKFIPPIGTRTGTPVIRSTNDISFNLILPAGTPPRRGWPVAIFGHGFTDSKEGAPIVVAASMASQGVATIAINVVGHGGGPLGTLTVLRATGAPVTIPAGGRGIDQDGNGSIDSTEGVDAAPPRALISSRDGLRQTVADLMQLVRVIETGGIPGLDRSRIFYAGQSFGGIYGTIFLAVEPSVRVGVPNVPGGPIIEIARLSPAFRPLVGLSLLTRTPSLLNAGAFAPPQWGFNENIPLRNQPPVINTVSGATAIQEVIENTEWVSQSGNPVAYAPHVRRSPLDGMDAKSVIVQFAKGDQTVPNPTAAALLRAGDLADRTLYFRNDLAFAANPATPKNPHTFLTNVARPSVAAFALGAQQQIAIFFATEGEVVIDPDGSGPFFEVPIAGPLPETLNFVP
jgi:hypothetical protein